MYFNYKSFNKKGIIIKDIIKSRLKLNDIKIKSLDDIAKLSERFGKTIPYCNFELIGGNYSIDIDSIVECIQSKGGRCLFLNIAFGLLLTEFGVEVQLLKAVEDSPNQINDLFSYHYANAFKWIDGKYYFHDQGLCHYNQFFPIEFGNHIPIKGYSKSLPPCLYKVIKNKECGVGNSFILQKQLIHFDGEFKSLFEFKLNDDITIDLINERAYRYNQKYDTPTAGILRDDGYYYYTNESIIAHINSNKKIKLIDKTNIDNLNNKLNKYFNIEMSQFKYFDNKNNQ